MKRRNKILIILSMIVFTMLQVGNLHVYADTQEDEDGFYEQHSSELEIEERSYLTNTEDGNVNIYKVPGSETVFYQLGNDDVAYVMYKYKDENGELWGILYVDQDQHPDIKEKWGWIKLSECKLKYDAILFNQKHSSEFVKEKTEFDVTKQTEDVILWSFPGSGEIQTMIDPASDTSKNLSKEYDTYYNGEDGEKWVFVTSYMGSRGWICVSNPTSKDLKVIDYDASENTEDESVEAENKQDESVQAENKQNENVQAENEADENKQDVNNQKEKPNNELLNTLICIILIVIIVLLVIFMLVRGHGKKSNQNKKRS